ncbi:MAG: hypothetical protein AB1861_30870 [Cyanobacteriota bacterium]
MKKAKGRRKKAEGSIQMGIQNLPEYKPLGRSEGIKPLLSTEHQKLEGNWHKKNLLPSAFYLLPFLMKLFLLLR